MFWKPLTDDGLHIDFAHRIFVWNSDAPVKAHVHCMVIGFSDKPIDREFYLFTQEHYEGFVRIEPRAKPFFHAWYGGQEFLYNTPRMCLWLGDCSPHQIKMTL